MSTNTPINAFLVEHSIHEVECLIPDMTGIARGKILPRDLFMAAGEIRLPKSVLLNTVNGQQPDNGPFVGDTDPDMVCIPDASTVRIVPWAAEPVAVVIHDMAGTVVSNDCEGLEFWPSLFHQIG